MLLDIGARPIAVEPNPEMARIVTRRYGVPVERAAVGAEIGEATLHVGRDPGHSTLSNTWHDLHAERSDGSITVPVVTLDALIERYGVPSFVKIDVEGYEAEVLRGLSTPIQAVSFEFQRGLPDVMSGAVERLQQLADYRFQFLFYTSDGESPVQPPRPAPWPEVEEQIRALPETGYGDIYAVQSSRA